MSEDLLGRDERFGGVPKRGGRIGESTPEPVETTEDRLRAWALRRPSSM